MNESKMNKYSASASVNEDELVTEKFLSTDPSTVSNEKATELSPLDKAIESHHHNTGTMSRYMTMTGTITRGRKKGQTVEVQVEVSEDEFDKIYSASEETDDSSEQSDCLFGIKKGPHVFFLSLLCIPVALLCSICVTFYHGSVTWYNIFIYLYEEKTIWHKIFLCPIVLLSFPVTVAVPSLFVGLYAMVIQLSWFFKSWKKEFTDFEKGLYGWICNKLDLTDCCPYEVVLIEDLQPSLPNTAPGRTIATTPM